MGLLEENAHRIVAAGKGILAADESLGTIEKRFRPLEIACTPENRSAYRSMLFSTPGLEEYISGVILFDETLRQEDDQCSPLPELLSAKGILPGIKVDRKTRPLAGFPGEEITQGLDDLGERLEEYAGLGATFTKWRAVIHIGPDRPSPVCLRANAHALARFAALSQLAGLVPVVEPEVLMDGDHDLARAAEVNEVTLACVFEALREHRVSLEGMILKPSMVTAGKDHAAAGVEEVAETTLRVFRRSVPAAVPGICFLSGGQGPVEATRHLNALNALGEDAPWELSFSFGRALQEPVLAAWSGEEDRLAAAQQVLLHRARCNSEARFGSWSPELEHVETVRA